MPTMTNRQSVAANTIIENVFTGQLNEFLANPSLVTFSGTASAVGLKASLIIGGQLFLDNQELSAQNRMPIIPDDVIAQGAGFKNDRCIVRLNNTTAGAITAFTRVDQEPRG